MKRLAIVGTLIFVSLALDARVVGADEDPARKA